MQNYTVHGYVISMEFSAVNRRRPSRETPLGPEAKKDGCFRRLYQEEWSIKLRFENGGWHESLNLFHVSRCEMLHFVTSYMKQNKSHKQTLESAQYGLEISFNYFSYTIQIGSNWYMDTGVRDLEVACFKANSIWINDIGSKDLSNRPIYAVLNTHNLDMILQFKYMPIVMNPARIASSDWKS